MTAIKKVTVAGATGRVGPVIVEQLVKQNFEVTILTRQDSPASTFPPTAKVERVDYNSKESLVAALKGQDAVVSTIGGAGLQMQSVLIDAAAEAGVRRFIPSEFGSDTTNPQAASLPLFKGKVAAQKALVEKANSSPNFTWTAIVTGPLLGWLLTEAFFSLKEKTARLYDGGDREFSTVTLPTVGKIVAAVLSTPDETANRVIKVHSTATTLNKLLTMSKKVVGEDGWTITNPSVDEALAASWAGVKQGKFDWPTLSGFVTAASLAEGYGGKLEDTNNKQLGIPEISDSELQSVIGQIAKH